MLDPYPPAVWVLEAQPWMTWLESSTRNWPNMDYLTRQVIMFVDLWFDNSSRRCSSFSIHSSSQITSWLYLRWKTGKLFPLLDQFSKLCHNNKTNMNQSFLLRAYLFQCIFLFFMCCPMQVFISSMWLEWDVIKIQISLWRSSYTHTTSNTPLRNWISVLSCRVISSNTSTNDVAKPLCSCFFYFNNSMLLVSILPKINPWKSGLRKSKNSKMAQNHNKI